jgi:hypothetical protein
MGSSLLLLLVLPFTLFIGLGILMGHTISRVVTVLLLDGAISLLRLNMLIWTTL